MSFIFTWGNPFKIFNAILYQFKCFLNKLNLAKYNYKIYNKELLAIIRYFKQ